MSDVKTQLKGSTLDGMRRPVRGIGEEMTRVEACDWPSITDHLDSHGWAVLPSILKPTECRALADLYDLEAGFRSHIMMARHGFGRGEYRYFSYPLPPTVDTLRTALYPHFAALANRWYASMGLDVRFPEAHTDFLERCHAAGQTKPTPLLLRYVSGDYNCLHQDLYGEHVFPLQVTFLLAEPDQEFTGGEFVLVEQRPRMQSRAMVVPLRQGDGVVFAVNQRPVAGSRGAYRVSMRHGVSEVHSGRRHTLGVIFHDAA
jgi:hypothetical protein